jgi:hypothetical protein
MTIERICRVNRLSIQAHGTICDFDRTILPSPVDQYLAVDLKPLESAAFPRRAPNAEVGGLLDHL